MEERKTEVEGEGSRVSELQEILTDAGMMKEIAVCDLGGQRKVRGVETSNNSPTLRRQIISFFHRSKGLTGQQVS